MPFILLFFYCAVKFTSDMSVGSPTRGWVNIIRGYPDGTALGFARVRMRKPKKRNPYAQKNLWEPSGLGGSRSLGVEPPASGLQSVARPPSRRQTVSQPRRAARASDPIGVAQATGTRLLRPLSQSQRHFPADHLPRDCNCAGVKPSTTTLTVVSISFRSP